MCFLLWKLPPLIRARMQWRCTLTHSSHRVQTYSFRILSKPVSSHFIQRDVHYRWRSTSTPSPASRGTIEDLYSHSPFRILESSWSRLCKTVQYFALANCIVTSYLPATGIEVCARVDRAPALYQWLALPLPQTLRDVIYA